MANIMSIKFPFQKGISSFPQAANDDEAIHSSIVQILSTPKGARPMKPTFGIASAAYIFENDSQAAREGLAREVRVAIATWEQRVSVAKVAVTTDDALEPGQVLVTINYVILQTGRTGTATIGH